MSKGNDGGQAIHTGGEVASHNHILTETILQDIADTEAEIAKMRTEITAYQMLGDKMSMFRADARREGIKKREVFIIKLEAILNSRIAEREKGK